MMNIILDRGGRSLSALIFLFWGAFFVEHLAEWFLRSDGQLPPPFVWAAQFLHLTMLLAFGWSVFRPLSGSFAILLTSAAFFGCIRAFPSIALINLAPVAMAWTNWLLKPVAQRVDE